MPTGGPIASCSVWAALAVRAMEGQRQYSLMCSGGSTVIENMQAVCDDGVW